MACRSCRNTTNYRTAQAPRRTDQSRARQAAAGVPGMSSAIIRRRVERNFTTLPNSLIEDTQLGWKTLGLLVYLLHLPADWRLNLAHLGTRRSGHGSNMEGTKSALRELQRCGYLAIRRGRDDSGKFKKDETDWFVTDVPHDFCEDAECSTSKGTQPQAGFPHVDYPHVENPPLLSNKFNQELKTTTTEPEARTCSSGVFDSLIIEPAIASFLPQLLETLRMAGVTDPAHAQDLLDELAGTIDAGKRGERQKVGNPVAWLKSVASTEDFTRARCFDIQTRRRSAKAHDQRMTSKPDVALDPAAMSKGEEMFAGVRRLQQSQSQHP